MLTHLETNEINFFHNRNIQTKALLIMQSINSVHIWQVA